uniref:Uncharacterized protein n=1 Tax=Paramormyrops kingsleyae TaxID=1676925 RepID=A0A3B3Q7J9_9TELE
MTTHVSSSTRINIVMCCLTTGIHSEKCDTMRFGYCKNIIVFLHKPRWYNLLHTQATVNFFYKQKEYILK